MSAPRSFGTRLPSVDLPAGRSASPATAAPNISPMRSVIATGAQAQMAEPAFRRAYEGQGRVGLRDVRRLLLPRQEGRGDRWRQHRRRGSAVHDEPQPRPPRVSIRSRRTSSSVPSASPVVVISNAIGSGSAYGDGRARAAARALERYQEARVDRPRDLRRGGPAGCGTSMVALTPWPSPPHATRPCNYLNL